MLKYTVLFIKPTIFGIIMMGFRFLVVFFGLLPKENVEISGSLATGFFALALFFPGFAVAQALSNNKETVALLYAANNNEKKIAEYKDAFVLLVAKKISPIMYAIIGVICGFSILLTSLISFESEFYGYVAVFATSYVKYLLLISTYELDDPFTGRFRPYPIPKDWVKACEKLPRNHILEAVAKKLL